MISTLWKHTGLIWKHHLSCLSALKRKICTSRKFRKNALCCENKRKGLHDQTGNSDLCWKNNYTNEKARLWLTQPQQLFYRYKSNQVWAQWGWVILEKYAISNFSDIVHTSLNVIWSLFQTRKMYITDFYLFTFSIWTFKCIENNLFWSKITITSECGPWGNILALILAPYKWIWTESLTHSVPAQIKVKFIDGCRVAAE